jgi:hypothetical protein
MTCKARVYKIDASVSLDRVAQSWKEDTSYHTCGGTLLLLIDLLFSCLRKKIISIPLIDLSGNFRDFQCTMFSHCLYNALTGWQAWSQHPSTLRDFPICRLSCEAPSTLPDCQRGTLGALALQSSTRGKRRHTRRVGLQDTHEPRERRRCAFPRHPTSSSACLARRSCRGMT